jgi:peptidoglycan/xylan/chitin deacetylase (PgdA/CDA1 family)
MRRRCIHLVALCVLAAGGGLFAQEPRTQITKWQDGKEACVSLTFDDSSINQFRIGMPLLNERGLPGTFFIETGMFEGSRNKPAFVGRPIMDIIRESERVPTSRENALERTSLLNYLRTIQQSPEISEFNAQRLGRLIRENDWVGLGKIVDGFMAKLRATGKTYVAQGVTRPPSPWPDQTTWDDLRRYAAMGHEFANHSITHPYMPALDEANIVYEIEASRQDMLEQLGPKHTFSIEAPYGIDDPRVSTPIRTRFPIARNWVLDSFMDGILRGDKRDPRQSAKEYMQWQRGPAAKTSLDEMKGWVNTSLETGIWLVLVFHGIEGIGYEALPTEIVRAYLDFIREQQTRVWVATYQDGAKYTRERHNSTVTSKAAGEAIEVTVTQTLDPKLYDLPLTAKTKIPADWLVVRFRQGNETRWIPIQRENGETFVLYRVAPNGVPATLSRGLNGRSNPQ